MSSSDHPSNYNNEMSNTKHASSSSNEEDEEPTKKSRFPPFDNSLSQDEKVVKAFVDTIQFKLDHHILKAPKGKERKLLQDAVFFPGFYIGAIAGVATFVLLRRGPIYVMNRMNASNNINNQVKAQTQAQQLLKNKSSSLVSQTPKTNHTKKPEFKEGPIMKVVGTIFDGILSSMIGLAVWTVSTDKQKVFTTAADIPLIEGRSEISNILCDDFINIYRNDVRPNFWKEYTDDSLTAISRFVHNCEKRHLYQRKIKREMGLRSGFGGTKSFDNIDLPSPVPDDIEDFDDANDWD